MDYRSWPRRTSAAVGSPARGGPRRVAPSRPGIALRSRTRMVSPETRAARADSATSAGSLPSQLADWLADRQRPAPVLLDVRTPAEWEVSHLPGARRVDPQANAKTAAGDLAKDAPIVTYCAVGYRSGAMAHRLRAAGYTQVQNLEGSIFQWANEHRPLVRMATSALRGFIPMTSFWGRLLEPDVRATAPECS